MGNFTTRMIEFVASLAGWRLYAVTFLLAFAEAAMFADLVVPGEVGLVVVGASASRASASLPVLIALAATGAVAGDLFSYVLGRTAGVALLHRWKWLRRKAEPKLERAQSFYEKRGGLAIVAARFVGALRALVPFSAGLSKMPAGRFLLFDVPAAVVWASIVVLLGWHFGERIAGFIDTFQFVLLGALVLAISVWYLRRRARLHNARALREHLPA